MAKRNLKILKSQTIESIRRISQDHYWDIRFKDSVWKNVKLFYIDPKKNIISTEPFSFVTRYMFICEITVDIKTLYMYIFSPFDVLEV